MMDHSHLVIFERVLLIFLSVGFFTLRLENTSWGFPFLGGEKLVNYNIFALQAAFLIPILAHMMRDGVTATQFEQQQQPECIIVAPTRELINQIFLESRKFAHG